MAQVGKNEISGGTITLEVQCQWRHIFSMIKPTSVEALIGYRIHLAFADGVAGVIDLSAEVGRGVFAPLADEAFFRAVHLGRYGQIPWTEEIEICSDAAYEEIAIFGRTPCGLESCPAATSGFAIAPLD